jgi:FkbM family methyltransferase
MKSSAASAKIASTPPPDFAQRQGAAHAFPAAGEAGLRYAPDWTEHDASRMARDFLMWRHLRVVRARAMRHVNRLLAALSGADEPRAVRTVYGVRMVPNWNDRTYAYCHYGTYGSYLADLIHSLDRPFAFLDIGANQGLFSLIAGQNPACEKIVALEPVPDTYARLTRNLAENGLSERGLALNFGLSDASAERELTINRQHSGLATLDDHLDPQDAAISKVTVAMRTMDELARHLPEHLPLFIKIDVEGHEATVIEQILGSPVAARVLGIFYEYDARWCDGDRIDEAMRKAGFATVRQYGRGKHFDALATPVS